jgi:PEGA domain-containing protein/heavy-metal resistance protein
MNDDRFAEQIKTALAERRPAPSRQLADRLEAAAQRPGRPRLVAPAALAIAVAAGVLLVIVTRPGELRETSESPVARVDEAGARAPSPPPRPAPKSTPALTPAPAPTPAPRPAQAPAPAGSPTAVLAKVDLRDPLAGYQAVLDGTSSVAIAPAQATRLRALAAELASQRAFLAERKRDAEAELARALTAAPPDDSRVLAAYDRIAAQDAALGRAQLVARLGARAVLDPGQRAAIEGTPQRAIAGRVHLTLRSPITGSVELDGKHLGDTPVSAVIAPGKHELRLDAPGCDPLTKSFEVGEGSVISLDLDPRCRRTPSPRPATATGDGEGHLRLTTRPTTTIYLDGASVGQTPVDLTLPTGRHEIKMVGSDQRTRKSMTFDVSAGQRSDLSFSFDD